LDIKLFPPQVLSDLNFFRVRDEQELAFRLKTLQRVAVAAIGAYLFVRYEPMLAKQLGLFKSPLRIVVYMGIHVCSACLSAPMYVLFTTAVTGSLSAMKGVSSYRDNKIGEVVFWVGGVFYCYVVSQGYKKHLESIPSPDFLERLFLKVGNRVYEPLWNRFYKK
jgi:hypothetical protein